MNRSWSLQYAVIGALVVGALFLYTHHLTRQMLQQQGEVLDSVAALEHAEEALKVELLETRSQGEFHYDGFTNLQQQMTDGTARLRALLEEQAGEAGLIEQVDGYAELQVTRQGLLEKYQTINSLLRNSVSQIPSLNSRYLEQFGADDQAYLYQLSRLTTATFLAANTMEPSFSTAIQQTVEWLNQHVPEAGPRQDFNTMLLAHARVFLRYLPLYRPLLTQIAELPSQDRLYRLKQGYLHQADGNLRQISLINLLLALGFIFTIGLVAYFLARLNHEHAKLGRLHRELRQSARSDALTGLPNRFAFHEDLSRNAAGGLILVNLDRFKQINDFYGNRFGDQILTEVADALRELDGEWSKTQLYRLGGDEFGFLTRDLDQRLLLALAEQALLRIEELDIQLEGAPLNLSARAGCSLQPPLLERADMALKEVKNSRMRVMAYDESLDLHAEAGYNLRIIRLVRNAIRDDRVVPFFQPLLNLSNNRVTRYECLMRIIDEEGQVIPPIGFLEVAQEAGLYDELARIMIEKSIARFHDQPLEFAINLSVEDILDKGVTGFLFSQLDRYPDVASRLILEVLESEGVHDYEQMRGFVAQAQARGCRVAIDDFGSGYSSLSHVMQLQADQLKIDGSLIRKLHEDENLRLLVASVAEFARSIGVRSITAEFVHSAEVLQVVRAMGLDYAQGFYIGKPQPELLEPGQPVLS